MSWRDAVPLALRMLLQRDDHIDPHLEILRLGAEHQDIDARDVTVTLVLGSALVTGTVISTDTWERLHLRRLSGHDDTLRRIVRDAVGHLDQAADEGRHRQDIDRRFLHMRDVTHRVGRTAHTLPLWRGSLAAVSGWSLGRPDQD
ncbi:hypothetical protein ACIQF6_33820 [Kitasatospora sp. NPDC092948]|uniref:hypothetical protein n=1 Tax=Kitasatospora sp. NPDC092948 TaxID=3364088 RepID=UPI0038174480